MPVKVIGLISYFLLWMEIQMSVYNNTLKFDANSGELDQRARLLQQKPVRIRETVTCLTSYTKLRKAFVCVS